MSYAKINDVVRDKHSLKYILLENFANILAASWIAAFYMAASWMDASWIAAS